jgi:hypothetical protein
MKLKNNILILLTGGLVVFAACKKELDQQPTATFSEENAFQTMSHVQAGVNGAFGTYSSYANDMYINALLSDEARLGANNNGDGAITYRYQFGSDGTTGAEVIGGYYGYYGMLDQINRVLPKIPLVKATAAEEPRRNILKGQLLALRAIAHFSLLEMYSDRYDASKPGVPIMIESCVLCKPARNTMGEVMAQIEKDLNEAKTLLPATTAANFFDTVTNQLNITGYQARIALFKRDYQKAVDYATTVINSGIKGLVSGSAFTGIWTDANMNEVLFRRRYATGTSIGTLWTAGGGEVLIAPSDKLVASYGAGDIRKAAYIGTNAAGNNYVNKFYTSAKGGRVVDIKAMRISEMYLIRAEAYAKLGSPNVAAGTADLNTLRGVRITGYSPVTFPTAGDLVTAVLQERFKELAFEGFRWFDLKRNGLDVVRNASDASTAWQTLPASSFRWILPIPRDEIIANPNTIQNPNY